MREKQETSFDFDYEAVKNKALEQLKTGKPFSLGLFIHEHFFVSFNFLVNTRTLSYNCFEVITCSS